MMTETKRTIKRTTSFKRQYKKAKKQGKNIDLLLKLINMLANDEPLPEKYRDHALAGDWKGYRKKAPLDRFISQAKTTGKL